MKITFKQLVKLINEEVNAIEFDRMGYRDRIIAVQKALFDMRKEFATHGSEPDPIELDGLIDELNDIKADHPLLKKSYGVKLTGDADSVGRFIDKSLNAHIEMRETGEPTIELFNDAYVGTQWAARIIDRIGSKTHSGYDIEDIGSKFD